MQVRLYCMVAAILAFALPAIAQTPETPLPIAVLMGDPDTISAHAAAGTDMNAPDAYGSRPVTIAATFGKSRALDALIAAGADLELPDAQGSNALHIAAFFGRTEMVGDLLNAGANRFARNGDGSTALDIVLSPFAPDRPTYDRIVSALGPLGLNLDFAAIAAARPDIAVLLRPKPEELAAVSFAPETGASFPIATPQSAGLDRDALADLFLEASHLENIFGLLVLKDGALVAERYFNGMDATQISTRQSITKSVLSALYGIGLEQGCAPALDTPVIDVFPEVAAQITDPRKRQITFEHMLQMRAGFPMELLHPEYNDALYFTDNWNWITHLVDFPLVRDPGSGFGYSNVTSELIAIALQRGCGTDLTSFGQTHLFGPIGGTIAGWSTGSEGYSMGWGELSISARDMARFGLLFLNNGRWNGTQIVPADWVAASFGRYTENAWTTSRLGRHIHDIGYGYQWWSATANKTRFVFAWGHGGQIIALLPDQNMVVVATADPLKGLDPIRDPGWAGEQAVLNVVGKYIATFGTSE